MKLPKKAEIINITYKGDKDEQGLPHKKGVMEYETRDKHGFTENYKYEGYFVHGKRHGYGTWSIMLFHQNPIDKYSWYSEGEYDDVGRLIHPKHESGSYEPHFIEWKEEYAGWWKDDLPTTTGSTARVSDFEITQDEAFLKRFFDSRDVRKLSPIMVEKLLNSQDPYGKYGYGQWLYCTQVDKESINTAIECFKEAAGHGIADADEMLYRMCFTDNEPTTQDSELTKLRKNLARFNSSNKKSAITEAEKEAYTQGASLLWMERLGQYYVKTNRIDKAIGAFEKCIDEGLYYPIFDLAQIYRDNNDSDFYEKLMKLGIKLNVPDCMALCAEIDTDWDSLTPKEQKDLHRQLKTSLTTGAQMGSGYCACLLAQQYIEELSGFQWDLKEALKWLQVGVRFNFTDCCRFIIQIMTDPDIAELIPKKMKMSEEELQMIQLKVSRYGETL